MLNVVAIAAGASVGTLLGARLPQRLRDTLVAALGLFTLRLLGTVLNVVANLLPAVLLAPGLVAAAR